jgi:TRAP-type C4-dicarboxylate transport system permease small subunit
MATIKEAYLRFFAIYARFAGFLSWICLYVAYFLLVAVTIIAVFGVYYRYVLIDPIPWAEEIARYILIWMTMIGASIAVKERKHVRLTSVLVRLPEHMALIIEIVFFLIIIFIIGLIANESIIMVFSRSAKIISPSLQISMIWAHTALPVGFALILIQSFYILFEDIKIFIAKESFREKITV